MKIADKILLLLEEGPINTKQLRESMSNRHPAPIHEVITGNQDKFIRLKRGLIGLKGRDDHLKELPIFKKILSLLKGGPISIRQLRKTMPNVHHSTIQSVIVQNPDKFIRLRTGVIGLRDRDDHLKEPPIFKKILSLLRRGPIRVKLIKDAMSSVSSKTIERVIRLNPDKFIRLKHGVIGLRDRDDHLKELPVFKKIFNILVHGPVHVQNIYAAIPEETRSNILSIIGSRPEFIRVKHGVIGRRGRDDWLQDRYTRVRLEHGDKMSIGNLLKDILKDGPKEFTEIYTKMPYHTKLQVAQKLSRCKDFERIGSCLWGLKT